MSLAARHSRRRRGLRDELRRNERQHRERGGRADDAPEEPIARASRAR